MKHLSVCVSALTEHGILYFYKINFLFYLLRYELKQSIDIFSNFFCIFIPDVLSLHYVLEQCMETAVCIISLSL